MAIVAAANSALLRALTCASAPRALAVMFDGVNENYAVKSIKITYKGDVPECPSVVECWEIRPDSIGLFLKEKQANEGDIPIFLRVETGCLPLTRAWRQVDTRLERIPGGIEEQYAPVL